MPSELLEEMLIVQKFSNLQAYTTGREFLGYCFSVTKMDGGAHMFQILSVTLSSKFNYTLSKISFASLNVYVTFIYLKDF